MLKSYEEAIDWINSRLRFGIKPGLCRMEWMMERLQHPEKKLKAIHVAGTNGKGSTTSFLSSILQEAGYTVGTFTSPYIESFNERISVNGIPISDDEIIKLTNVVKPLAEELEKTDFGEPTEFEIITAMAFYYFAINNNIDFVIIEVGLGGRLDSTNIITPMISLITNIGHDHMNILGDTISEIAYEKSGIIKKTVPVITAVDQSEALEVMIQEAKKNQSKLIIASKDYFIKDYETIEGGERFTLNTPACTYSDLQITMKGPHQVKNASLAVMAILLLAHEKKIRITENQIRTALLKTKWIGRFEEISTQPQIIIDGAHNPEGIQSLIETMKSHLKGKRIYIIFSALRDKSVDKMINSLASNVDHIVFTSFHFHRASSAKELYDQCSTSNKSFKDDWKKAIQETLNQCDKNDALIITGSLYFILEIRKYLLKF